MRDLQCIAVWLLWQLKGCGNGGESGENRNTQHWLV